MPYCWALDLVTLETFFTVRVRARSNAKRMMRSQPFSVNSAVCRATSLPGPRPAEVAAAEAGVLAFAVLPDDDPVEFGVIGLAQRGHDAGQELDRADVGPLVEVLGDVQAQAPQADVVGHVRASRPRRSRWRRSPSGSRGRRRPSSCRSARSTRSPRGTPPSRRRTCPSECAARVSSTRRPAATTSLPTPSAGIAAILNVCSAMMASLISGGVDHNW